MGPFARTYLDVDGRHFYVSTTNRECSSPHAHGHVYAETLAWETLPTGDVLLGTFDDAKDSAATHWRVLQSLNATGSVPA